MRLLATVLLIVTVLMCPYGCWVGGICCGPEESAVRSCCGKCCHDPQSESDSVPAPEQGPSKSCLCDGAVLGLTTFDLCPHVEAQADGIIVTWTAGERPSSVALHQIGDDTSRPGGMSLRIALRSFLC